MNFQLHKKYNQHKILLTPYNITILFLYASNLFTSTIHMSYYHQYISPSSSTAK